MSLLVAEGLSKAFGGRIILEGVNLSCGAGEVLVVMGGSGSGKTTLLRMVAGLTPADSGTVTVGDGRRDRIAYVPQGESLFPWLTVAENILVPLRVGRQKREIAPEDRERMSDLLARFGIARTQTMRPGQLSGGMRQRVAIARSLMVEPDLLLLDEPFSALDEAVRHRIERDVRNFVTESGIACLFITHSVDQAIAMGDHIGLLEGQPARLNMLCTIHAEDRPVTPRRYGELRAALLESLHAIA